MFRMFAKVPATFTYMDLRAGRQNSVFSQRCADVLRISCRNRCFPDEFRNKPCFTRCLSPVEFLIPLQTGSVERLRRKDVDVKNLRKLQDRRLRWEPQTNYFCHGVHVELRCSRLKWPGQMMNLNTVNLRGGDRVQAVALGDELLEIALL